MDTKEKIFAYLQKKYGILPHYSVKKNSIKIEIRHPLNQKCFAFIKKMANKRKDAREDGALDSITINIGDPMLADTLSAQEGYMLSYQKAKGKFISILLDGTVPLSYIKKWLDKGYLYTADPKKAQHRAPKEWLIPANPKYYDILNAFDNKKEIDWKQGAGIRVNDTVFMYVAAPVGAILYECIVTKTDIPYDYQDGSLRIKALMRIKLKKRYNPHTFTFEILKNEYGIFAVRGPRGVPYSLLCALKNKPK